MHLPTDKVNITWGQLEEVLRSFPERLLEIDRLEAINSCYPERDGDAELQSILENI